MTYGVLSNSSALLKPRRFATFAEKRKVANWTPDRTTRQWEGLPNRYGDTRLVVVWRAGDLGSVAGSGRWWTKSDTAITSGSSRHAPLPESGSLVYASDPRSSYWALDQSRSGTTLAYIMTLLRGRVSEHVAP